MGILLYFVGSLISGFVCYRIARSRNWNTKVAAFLGFVFNIFGVLGYVLSQKISGFFTKESQRKNKQTGEENGGEVKECPYCAEKVKQKANKCKHCGSDLSDEALIKDGKKSGLTRGAKFGLAFIITMVIAGFFVNYGPDNTSPTDEPEQIDKITATVMSQTFIRPRLKSPSSADFCEAFESSWVQKDDNRYVVDSCVDSQNSFGATIRTNYEVDMTYEGGTVTSSGNWSLNKLVIDGEVVVQN